MARLFFMPQAVRIDSTGTPYPAAYISFTLTGTTTNTNTYTDNALGTPHANPVVADSAGQFAAIYLDPAISYRARVYDADDNLLDDIDPVHVPFGASSVSVTDSGGYFADTDIEAVLQDIGANYAVLADDEDISGDWTVSGSMDFEDAQLVRPYIKDAAYVNSVLTSALNAVAWSLQDGNSATHTLTENTTITISNWAATTRCQIAILKVLQDGAGGAYTLAFAGTQAWGGGATPSPVMSTGNDSVRIFTIKTWDAGTTIYIDYAGAYGV